MSRSAGSMLAKPLGIVLLLLAGLVLCSAVHAAEPNHPPVLKSQQVNPYNSDNRAHYRFSVRYVDSDCDLPKSIQVFVDGKPYRLQAKRGKGYDAVYLSQPVAFEPGPHKYYFEAEDARGMTVRSPRYGEWTGPYVADRKCARVYNTYPELTDGHIVQGEEGDVETYFTFSVHFSDYDSTPAQWVKVIIDGLPHPMKLLKGTAHNGTYIYNVYLDTPPHGFWFTAKDHKGAVVTFPTEGFIRGPTVYDLANANPQLTDMKVDPELGGFGEGYTYRVHYHDIDKDPPAVIQVYINGFPHNLKLVGGDPYDGVYSFRTSMTVGNYHSYSFRAEDGRGGEAVIPITGMAHGPVVVNQP